MAIDGTNGVSGAISSIAAGGNNSALNKVDFNTFLTLLVTQLKNQDPLNPMDGTQFTGQIAQFSQLEQQINSNGYLKELLSQRDFGQQALATGYIGREVLIPGNTFSKTATDSTPTVGYSLQAEASSVEVDVINNETGQVVKTVNGDTTKGSHTFVWDGKNDSGEVAPNGNYTLRITAMGADDKVVVSSPLTFGKVSSVINDAGLASVVLSDGRTSGVTDVVMVR